MTIVLATTNRWKIAEYRRFLSRHAQSLLVEHPTEDTAILATWLDTSRAVLADESNIFDPAGDLVDAEYIGPARNVCRLHAWVKNAAGKIVRRTYIREVAGRFDGSRLRPDDPGVFDWDAAFSVACPTLEEMDALGLKNSAREQCLSAFAKAYLHHKSPKRLRWTTGDLPEWSIDARLLLEHPCYQRLAPPLASALAYVVNQGVLFRAAKSRRDGNYWFPGLNGGLPYVPKSDAIHEATYMFHDAMHHLMPDLVFDGHATSDHKRVYIAYRMMSEAVSLGLADMVFVHGLASAPANRDYDFTKRRIYPLYEALDGRRDDLRWLLKQLTVYVLRGEPSELQVDTAAWDSFETKYTRFFVADFQWTRMNWLNMVARTEMTRAWIDLLQPDTFRAQGVWLLSDFVDKLGRDLPLPILCDRLFDEVWRERLATALTYGGTPDVALSRSNGVRRWLTGQCALFARYAPIVGWPLLADALASRIRDLSPFPEQEIGVLRGQVRQHVHELAAAGVISNDDAAIFPDLFPLFDPFFLRDYDEAQQEFDTVREASAIAFA